MPAKKIPYVNRFTGDVKVVTRQGAKKLSEDYSKAKFMKNEKGEDVMRFEMAAGNGVVAVVDISENGEQEVELNGKRSTK